MKMQPCVRLYRLFQITGTNLAMYSLWLLCLMQCISISLLANGRVGDVEVLLFLLFVVVVVEVDVCSLVGHMSDKLLCTCPAKSLQ
jgi:hypothetical protein